MRLERGHRYRLAALATVLAIVLAACGNGRGDDDSSSGSGSSTTASGGAGGTFDIDTSNCTTDPNTVTLTGDTIKIGTSLPQSGIYAAFTEILNGEKAYFDYINDTKGGVEIAGKKYKVDLVAQDDAYDAQKTFANVQTLVENDKVFALFNVVGTKNNLAIRDYLGEQCVPNLFAASGAPQWGNHDYPWLIGTELVPSPDEMQALVTYLKANKPKATIAILRANDDFGAAYSETLKSLVKGTDLTIKAEQSYDTETGDVASQMTTLAASNADVFVLGATLLACPTALNQLGTSSWKPLVYMSGTCTSKTLMTLAGANGNGVLSVTPLMDPNDPAWANNTAMALYKAQVPKYTPEADVGNGIVAYGWTTAALLEHALGKATAANRLAVMQAVRTLTEANGVGLQLPDAQWTVSADDWFLGEEFNIVQYSTADGFFKTVGDLQKLDGKTASITPPNLING
jgi:branched-chain amino acid transport system substrate-binding protein